LYGRAVAAIVPGRDAGRDPHYADRPGPWILAGDPAGALGGLRAGVDMTAWLPSGQTAGTGSHRP
jgi:hypothetical protein